MLACSPTIDGESRIQKAFLDSDQREYFVPCPACGELQVLNFRLHVKWDNSLPTKEQRAASAYYECEHCHAHWNDVDRWRAVEQGRWTAAAPFAGVAGFRISELCSPWKKLCEIVLDFLTKKDDPEQLKTFVNTSLAETYVLRGDAPPADAIYRKREFYDQGVVPDGALFLTAFVDVQEDRLEVEIKGWARDGSSWSVGADVINGDTLQPQVWDALHEVIQQDYAHANGGTLPLWAMGIDSGYRPQKVYDFCARYAQPAYGPAGVKFCAIRTVVPTKGGHGWDKAIEAFSSVDAAKRRGGVRLLTLGPSYLKQAFLDSLRLPVPKDGEPFLPGFSHYPDYTYEWFRGLCSESRVVHENGKVEWVPDKSVRNEPLDLAVGNLAMYHLVRTYTDLWSDSQWAELDQLTRSPEMPEQQAPARPQREPWIAPRPNWLRPQ